MYPLVATRENTQVGDLEETLTWLGACMCGAARNGTIAWGRRVSCGSELKQGEAPACLVRPCLLSLAVTGLAAAGGGAMAGRARD